MPSPPSEAQQKSGPFPPPALPGLSSTMTLSDTRRHRRLSATLRPLPSCRAGLHRLPAPPFQRAVPSTPAIKWVHVSIASPSTRPSPLFRRVGIRNFTFEACSGFTHVTARWIAQPPKAAFVTRLRPNRLPDRAARQLPELSTTLRVESPSTGGARLRRALNKIGYGSRQAGCARRSARKPDSASTRALRARAVGVVK